MKTKFVPGRLYANNCGEAVPALSYVICILRVEDFGFDNEFRLDFLNHHGTIIRGCRLHISAWAEL